MKRAFRPFQGLVLLLIIAHLAFAQSAGGQSPEIRADAGGPYTGSAGEDLSFDASRSSGAIAYYSWDFGDGAAGSGKTVKHSYAKEGTYLLTLMVADEAKRSDTYSTGMYINPRAIRLEVSAEPRQDRYDYGDVISGVGVKASYTDGRQAEGLGISGRISGKDTLNLVFRETGTGTYHADANYPIVKGEKDGREEGDFINVSVEAKDAGGITGRIIKKLTIIPGYTGSSLTIQPQTGIYAYGEKIGLRALFRRLKDGRTMDEGKGEVILYEDWSGKALYFRREGNEYVSGYQIPADAGESLEYIAYAKGVVDGTMYNASNDLHYTATHDLSLAVVSPANDTYVPLVKDIKIKITYPDGEALPDETLKAYAGSDQITLKRAGDLFEANYSVPANKSWIHVWIFDGLGNGAMATVNLSTSQPPAESKEGTEPITSQSVYALLPAIAVLLVLFFAYRLFSARRRKRSKLEKEYEECRQKILSLKAVTKNIMNEFYTRRISEEEARKRVLESEKEIASEKLRLKALSEKLGRKTVDADGKAGAQETEKKE